MEVSGQIHALAALHQVKSLCYPLDRRLDGAQSWSGCSGEEKNSQSLPAIQLPIIQPVVQRYFTVSQNNVLEQDWWGFERGQS
jgi:hypothetical protein